jgi:YhcG PDDEXK nuclease domain
VSAGRPSAKVSAVPTQLHPEGINAFKDAYMLEFLGRDFCFVGSQFPVQVGGRDFALDLLFFHRSLNCLVAIEPHENPAIGVLLCASKDDEVVEYALSRTASPALITQYETQLPDKALLQSKLHEFYLQNTSDPA